MRNEGQIWDSRPLIVSVVYISSCCLLAELVNKVVEVPYLDEIFHIPQARQYCKGQYNEYHPKLTTPPGLYYISVLFAKAIFHLQRTFFSGDVNTETPCHTTRQLRYVCLVSLLLMPWILGAYKSEQSRLSKFDNALSDGIVGGGIKPMSPMEALTLAESNPPESARMARNALYVRQIKNSSRRHEGYRGFLTTTLDDMYLTAEVHTISLLPPLHFFGYLYYTDVPSTVLVMVMLLASRKEKDWLAALIGCTSLTLRQTNLIWVLFAFGLSILRRLETIGLAKKPLADIDTVEQLRSVGNLPLSKTSLAILRSCLPYAPVAVLGLTFLARNGSIVLGDKEHHQVVTHWAQPLYCVSMMTLFAWPALLSSLLELESGRFKKILFKKQILSLTIISLAAIRYGTVAHPFMLADNRHYTFYLWRRVLNLTKWSRYSLAPCYAVMLRLWWLALAQHHNLFWVIGFALCTSAAIIPSPLIEPRYYIIPYLIARLHLRPIQGRGKMFSSEEEQNRQQKRAIFLAIELMWAFIINAATIFLFLYRPFLWPDSSNLQRFMW